MARLLSGFALGALVVGAVWWLSPLHLLILAELTLLAAFWELAALAERIGTPLPRAAAAAVTCSSCAAIGGPWVGPVEVPLMAGTLGLGAIILTSASRRSEPLHEVAVSLFAAVYLGLPLGALVATRALFSAQAVLLLIATIVVSDTLQFYGGRLLGRHLLAPAISPKKTIEGAMVGIFAGTATFVIAGAWWLPPVGMALRAVVGAAVVAAGILGDLFESVLKRHAGVKDASAIIPGHGGILDRIDALLFAAPVYYMFLRLL